MHFFIIITFILSVLNVIPFYYAKVIDLPDITVLDKEQNTNEVHKKGHNHTQSHSFSESSTHPFSSLSYQQKHQVSVTNTLITTTPTKTFTSNTVNTNLSSTPTTNTNSTINYPPPVYASDDTYYNESVIQIKSRYPVYYNLPYGRPCDQEKGNCSLTFKELGPFQYEQFSSCYIYQAFSGPDDQYRLKDSRGHRIYMDINASLKCIVKGLVYSNVQRVNIYGHNNRFPDRSHFKPGTKLRKGTTTIINDYDMYMVTLGDCTNIWTYRSNLELDCEVDHIN